MERRRVVTCDRLFGPFGDRTDASAADPGDAVEDSRDPGQAGFGQHGVSEPVQFGDLAKGWAKPVRGAGGPLSAHRAQHALHVSGHSPRTVSKIKFGDCPADITGTDST